MFNTTYQTAVEQLQAVKSDCRLVILHPNYTQQHLLLNVLLQNNAIYVRFEGRDLTLEELRTQMRAALTEQTGREMPQAGDVLVLDECDRAKKSDLDDFLLETVNAVTRVFSLTRTLPLTVLKNASLRSKACFIPADEGLMLWDYAQRQTDRPHLLEVRALGAGRVMFNGTSVEDWDGVLPRSLFFYLVDKGMTTRNDIFDTFWPNLSVREATNVFHVTKRKISEVLGTDLTNYASGFYRISPLIELSYDVAQFNQMVADSDIAAPDDAARLLHRAIGLYRNDFLTSLTANWAVQRREELRTTFGDALIALAKNTEKRGQRHESLGLHLQASVTNPQREDIAYSIMQLYNEMGQPDDALAAFVRLEAELKEKLGVTPASHIRELANKIRRETSAVR